MACRASRWRMRTILAGWSTRVRAGRTRPLAPLPRTRASRRHADRPASEPPEGQSGKARTRCRRGGRSCHSSCAPRRGRRGAGRGRHGRRKLTLVLQGSFHGTGRVSRAPGLPRRRHGCLDHLPAARCRGSPHASLYGWPRRSVHALQPPGEAKNYESAPAGAARRDGTAGPLRATAASIAFGRTVTIFSISSSPRMNGGPRQITSRAGPFPPG